MGLLVLFSLILKMGRLGIILLVCMFFTLSSYSVNFSTQNIFLVFFFFFLK